MALLKPRFANGKIKIGAGSCKEALLKRARRTKDGRFDTVDAA